MAYTVQQLATLAGVSARTLHHYDSIGLLRPASVKSNGYRQYEEAELLRLQQIMFFRELEFSLEDIRNILANPRFDMRDALKSHRKLIEIKKKRMDELLRTIDATITKVSGAGKKAPHNKNNMTDKDLYNGFSSEKAEQYAKEARERWGDTDAYKESQRRVSKMTKEDMAQVQKEGEELTREIADLMKKGSSPESKEAQALIARHYDGLRNFYEPNLEMYRGLASMYVDDPRFTAHYDSHIEGLAIFMRDAMHAYCDARGQE